MSELRRVLVIGEDPGILFGEDVEVYRRPDFVEMELGEEDKFDQIYLTGALECIPREQVVDTLAKLGPILAELGELHVRVPSLEWACKEIASVDSPNALAYRWLYGTTDRPHRSGFTLLWLRLAMLNAGYNVRKATQLVVRVATHDALENYAYGIWRGDEAGA